jgi:hypothetical protein
MNAVSIRLAVAAGVLAAASAAVYLTDAGSVGPGASGSDASGPDAAGPEPAGAAPPSDSITEISPGDAELRPVARLSDRRIDECSGIVHHDGAFWVHNDSGAGPILYRSETLDFASPEALPLPGARAVDWEEITVYDGDLLVCDIGDNDRERGDLVLYRARYRPPGRLERVATYPFRYPDGKHDAEAAAVIDGRVHIFTRARTEPLTFVYRFERLRDVGELRPGEANVPERVGTLDVGKGEQVTGAAIDPETGTVILLTYSAILRYPEDRLSGEPDSMTLILARQCEAVCLVDRKLVFTNEERDVFVVDDFLARRLDRAVPPRANVVLPAGEEAVPIPLRNARAGDRMLGSVPGDRIRIRARIGLDKKAVAVRPAKGKLGTSLLLMFGRERTRGVTRDAVHVAVGPDARGRLAAWRVDLMAGDPAIRPFDGAAIDGRVAAGALEFELTLPLAGVFGEARPERFLFDVQGIDLRDRDEEPYFSSPGRFSSYRPFAWGEVGIRYPATR